VADGEILVLCQDMTISRADFLRSLPGAVNHVPFAVDPLSGVRSLDPGQHWRIALTPLPELCIGLLRLPRLRVAILLAGYDAADTTRFLDRFERYFRRAGG
jgi:hypothetical protein